MPTGQRLLLGGPEGGLGGDVEPVLYQFTFPVVEALFKSTTSGGDRDGYLHV
jgi:hypothetical protein